MKKSFLLLAFIIPMFSSFGQNTTMQSIDEVFAAWDQAKTPGAALGVFKDGEILYAKGYGLANMEYDIPNDPNSVFRIGSTSKQFTAACIVLLAEQGKLSLEDKLHDFFPDFPDYAKQITVQHLLNHTSGIRDYLTLAYLKGLRDDDFYTDEELMEWLVNQTDLNFAPGEEYVYSNSGYWLLGQIVKEASGKNMADFAQEAIFGPLGMENTHFHNDHTAIVPNRASGYTPTGENSYAISMTTLDMIGDGGIFTTINDIKKWDDAFYASEVLSKDFWAMMTRQGVLNNGKEIDYASGLEISEYRGLKTIRHGGAFVGFRADLLRFPEQKLTIAVFANRADGDPWAKADQVADILLENSFKEEEEAEMAAGPAKTAFISLSTKELEAFTGHYWNATDALSREIKLENDTLRYVRNERSQSTLVPIGQNEFQIINIPVEVRVQFVEAYGTQMAVTVEDDTPLIFVGYEPISYQAEALKPFVGTYYSQELDVEYVLKLEEDTLMLYLNGNPIAPLDPIMKQIFSNDYYGVFTFTEKQGVITEFRLAAGRVKNLQFTKR